jgi:tRNA pseudouridine38-40 synthase
MALARARFSPYSSKIPSTRHRTTHKDGYSLISSSNSPTTELRMLTTKLFYSAKTIYYYKVQRLRVMQNYKILICYDGTEYQGWQRQPIKKTIQGALENALEKIAGKKIPVIGSGRTDAGVHAEGQVAHFRVDSRLENDEFLRALNGILPSDIRILSLKKASLDFHARKSARSKIYRYRIFNSPDISPFVIRYVLQWTSWLDAAKMEEASGLFVREADFTPFSSNRLLSPVRSVTRSEIRKKGKEIIYTVEANGFLRYMVRSIVGALIEVGRGKLDLEQVEGFFDLTRRSHLCPTAPAKGLTLIKVKY